MRSEFVDYSPCEFGNRKAVHRRGCYPGPIEPHFAKLLDVHMMCVQSGRERTADEYAGLLSAAGWRYTGTLHPPEGLMCVITAVST